MPRFTCSIFLFLLISLLGGYLKYRISFEGHRYDFESYKIQADCALAGKNIYTCTERYNYGPLWYGVVGALRDGTESDREFRTRLVVLLSIADTGVAALLWFSIGLVPALLFLLNPISLIVSGLYNQFDVIAILIAFIGIAPFVRGDLTEGRMWWFSACLGVSLLLKHVLAFLPVMLFARADFRRYWIQLIFPYVIFAFGFVPFVTSESLDSIVQNVFLYQSVHNVGLPKGVIKAINPDLLLSHPIFFLALLFGWLLFLGLQAREWKVFHFFALALAGTTAMLPGMAVQYLAIPMIFIVSRISGIYRLLYLAVGTLMILSITPQLDPGWLDHRLFRYSLLQLLLLAAIAVEFMDRKESA